MKATSSSLALLALFASCATAARLSDAESTPVGKVVKMLQTMLTKSQDDWKSDKEAYGKFKCYCDDNTDKKTKAIQEATTSILMLTNKIEEIKGSSGALSVQTEQLRADMAENANSRDTAKGLREKQEVAFQAEEKDLVAAIGQMEEAVKLLSAIGADQTLAAGADHEKFMGNYKQKSLVSIQSSLRQAMTAAGAFLAPEKKAKFQAFLQAPFTGTYSAQSGPIMGILKDMVDTFKSNLASARGTEKTSKATYLKFKSNKDAEHADLQKSYSDKQASLGSNDGDLSTKKTQLQQFSKQKEEDDTFLARLTAQCDDKSETYENRKLFAANEQMSLSKAIAILNNDVAAEKFGAVDAASKAKASAFLQLTAEPQRIEAAQLLQKAAIEQHSASLDKVIMLLRKGDPFTVILQQIDKMMKLHDDEQKVDDEQKAWCKSTNTKNQNNLEEANGNIDKIDVDISKLNSAIDDPKNGLKKQLSEAGESLKTNLLSQATETKTRRDDNIEYQKDVHNMQDTIGILSKAEVALTDYYNAKDNEQIGLIQQPQAADYKGQNEQAKTVIGLLAQIKSDTLAEETVAHNEELKSQHDYEDSMKSLTDSEQSLQESIAKLNEDLANSEKQLLSKHQDQTNTEQSKVALERYIQKIKPGCDFIQSNYDLRVKNRKTEKAALLEAKTKLEGTPAFQAAQQKAKEESFGKCKVTCLKDEAAARCKACLAGVSVPGYCAGHKGAAGC